MRRRGLVLAFPLLLVAYLAYALYPYQLRAPAQVNAARRGADEALLFTAPGIAVLEAQRNGPAVSHVAVHVRAAPSSRAGDGARRTLVSVRVHSGTSQLALEQRGADLCVIAGADAAPWARDCEVEIPVLGSGRPVEIGVDWTGTALEVRVDGRRIGGATVEAHAVSPALDGIQVLVGNVEDSARPWYGRLDGLVVKVGDEDFDVARRAVLPSHVPTVEHAPELVPFRSLRPFDAVQNFVGFIPLGVWLALLHGAAVTRRRVVLRAATVGAVLGLCIEVAQWWLPARFVSVDDVWLNATGCATGAWLCWLWRVRRMRSGH